MLPSSFQPMPKLRDSGRRHAELLRGSRCRFTASQSQCNLPAPTGQQPQPTCKVDSACRDVSRRCSFVFDNNFPPAILFRVEVIEPIDMEALSVLGVSRHHVSNPQTVTDLAPNANVGNRESSQCRGKRQFFIAEFDEPSIGRETVGHDFLNQLLAKLGAHFAKRDLGSCDELPAASPRRRRARPAFGSWASDA